MAAEIPVVRDHIIPIDRYPSVNENQTLGEAVRALLSYTCGNDRLRYSELLVLNGQSQLVGHLSLQAILKALDKRLVDVPRVKEHEGKSSEFPNLSILWEESFLNNCSLKKNTPILEFMLREIRHVKAGDSLVKALAIVLQSNEDILPVLENETVVGVIRLEEIFKAICHSCNL